MNYTDSEWHTLNLEFLNKHNYHAIYCQDKRKKRISSSVSSVVPYIAHFPPALRVPGGRGFCRTDDDAQNFEGHICPLMTGA